MFPKVTILHKKRIAKRFSVKQKTLQFPEEFEIVGDEGFEPPTTPDEIGMP